MSKTLTKKVQTKRNFKDHLVLNQKKRVVKNHIPCIGIEFES